MTLQEQNLILIRTIAQKELDKRGISVYPKDNVDLTNCDRTLLEIINMCNEALHG